MKRFLRKNAVLILVILVIGVVAYNYTYTEGFQSTARVGGTCPGPLSMATLSGICSSGFKGNTTTGKCEKTNFYCSEPSKYILNGKRCVLNTDNTIVIDALFNVEQRNYTCPTGMVSAGNMRCVRTGTYRCPSGSVPSDLSSYGKCIKCSPGTTYMRFTRDFCTRRSDKDKSKIIGTTLDPVCSI